MLREVELDNHNELLRERLEAVIPFAEKQVERMVSKYPDCFPVFTTQGVWSCEQEARDTWCEGFLGGMMWLLYSATGKAVWKERAEHYSRLIAPRRADESMHDLGYLFLFTTLRGYELTGTEEWQAVSLEAAETLAKHYQPQGHYLCSAFGPESLLIDQMVDVCLLFYAAQVKRDRGLFRMARNHTSTSRRMLMRGDGSTAQEGLFDRITGEYIKPGTRQGWRADSCWARGQTWALYGFAMVYEYTRDAHDLASAELLAQYYLENAPAHGVPPNDFNEPGPRFGFETSAAAVAACGLWKLARLTGDASRAVLYRQSALQILDTLTSTTFLASESEEWEGLIKHGIYHARLGLGVDESLIFGDHFFLEAVCEALKDETW